MAERVPFFTLFESFQAPRQLRLLLHDACAVSGVLDREARTLEVQIECGETLPQAAQDALQQMLAQQYDLRRVLLHFRGMSAQKGDSGMVWGKPFTGKVTPIRELNIKMGNAVVEGRVFKAECYETRRKGMWTLNFNITDEHGSVAVRKAMDEKEAKVLGGAVSDGMWLRIQGKVELTYDGRDIVLRPVNIMKAAHPGRQDNAPEKRVELHLHTQMSSMDALTDVGKVVKQAAAWGHPAIAITDHGTVQAFPKARDAAKGKIKVLYGVEGYYVNNLDDRIAVHGAQDQDFDDEIVCFDIETTGLKVTREAITEIGAVVLKNGNITETFQTFVNPGRRLTPEIIGLTGITDAMLADAPSLKEALTAFLQFVNGRVLAAHNAEFDISFIRAGCRKVGLEFEPTYIDSLILAQNLLPELHKYKLDIVAEHLDLPAFNHHRASDDAGMVGYMLVPFFEKMRRELGISRLQEINGEMEKLRPLGGGSRHPKHIIILAKNKLGLKHLYQLVSASNLKYFKRYPIIPKTELVTHREGLIIGSACEAGELFRAVADHKDWAELRRIASFYDYLEIQPICNNMFMLRNGTVQSEEELRELQPHHRPAGTGAGEAGVRHRRRALPGAGGRGVPAHPAGQQEVRGRGRAAAHLLQDHGGDAGGVRLSGSGGGASGGHRRPAIHRRPHRGDRAAAAGTAVPAAAGELRAGAARQGVEQVPRAVRRRAAPAGGGSIERGAEEHSGQVRRGVYVRPEAGAAQSGKRLSGGQPRVGWLVAGGVYVGHHGGELPAAPLPLP